MSCMKFLSVRSDVCRQLLSDSTSQWTPLLLAIQFPLLGLARDFHPLDNAHAERTPKGAEALIINASAPYCMHLLFYLTTRDSIFLYLTTIVTMVDNDFMIFMGALDNVAYHIVEYCRTLSFKQQGSLIILYLTTIVTMVDNIINNIHGSIG